MISHYITLEMHKFGNALIKPGEIVSFSAAAQEGSRIVTRQNQIFYVKETTDEVDQLITDYFKN